MVTTSMSAVRYTATPARYCDRQRRGCRSLLCISPASRLVHSNYRKTIDAPISMGKTRAQAVQDQQGWSS